jgi:ribonuclease P protein component
MNNLLKLRKNTQFKRVYNEGKYFVEKFVVLYLAKNEDNISRVGYSVGKKVGNSVIRNRVKRRMREIIRKEGIYFKNGLDLIFMARASSSDASFSEIKQNIDSLIKRARLKKM